MCARVDLTRRFDGDRCSEVADRYACPSRMGLLPPRRGDDAGIAPPLFPMDRRYCAHSLRPRGLPENLEIELGQGYLNRAVSFDKVAEEKIEQIVILFVDLGKAF
jgi:hypothetical protein